MSLSKRNEISSQVNGELLEKVIIQNDLSGLSSIEKVQHIKNVCTSLGLNPLTKPIQLLKFQGKEIPYVTKDATEQLRKINKVSISIKETKMVNNDVYMVIVEASTPEGRIDSSTGAIAITGLKGDALCNAMLKAETKAKRRATLSICGLGFIDESEAESIPGSKKVDVYSDKIEDESLYLDLNSDLDRINSCKTIDELQEAFAIVSKFWKKNEPKLLMKIVEAKDKKKSELLVKEFNDEIDVDTGEVLK